MDENGMCSTDKAISELKNKVSEAENEIATVLSKLLPHIRVSGISVSYHFGTSRSANNSCVYVTMDYRIS